MSTPIITLNDKTTIPALGFGTYLIDQDSAEAKVAAALEVGYRHLDTAQMYRNEEGVGAGIAASGLPREQIYLTTKLDNDKHDPEAVEASFAESIAKLQTDYVDLFLMHWPLPTLYGGDFITTYRVMEGLIGTGQLRSVGVSNFQTHHLEKLLSGTSIVPAVNQIEVHPYFQNREVVTYCQDHGITVESWSPLGRGVVLDDPTIAEIATAHSATPAQIILAWHLAKGFVTIPKASTEERQAENFAASKIALSAEDIERIDGLDRGEEGRTGPHPDTFAKL